MNESSKKAAQSKPKTADKTYAWENHIKAIIKLQALYRGFVARCLARRLRAGPTKASPFAVF